jgi:predicted ABC-type ATPase
VAGPNGSGKSTLTGTGYRLFREIDVLDPDALAKTIQVGDQADTALQAGRQTLLRIQSHFDKRESFAVETTLSGRNYLKQMEDARHVGYQVALIFVATGSVELNIERVRQRVEFGGHDVPEVDIRRRYERSLQNLPKAIRLSNPAVVFENSAVETFRILLLKRDGVCTWSENLPAWAAKARAELENL